MLKIGHRGASASAPENTLTSFRRAISLGADGVELDIHRCKTGELIVIHDDTVDRTTGGKGRVADMTLAELKALSIEGSEHIPTLEEVLQALGQRPYCFIEVKHAADAVAAAQLIESYTDRGWSTSRLVLISFQHDGLREARKVNASLTTGASFEQMSPESAKQAVAIGARYILPNYRMIKEVHMKYAMDAELSVIPWTVNDWTDISRTRLLNVGGIISDYPERLSAEPASV